MRESVAVAKKADRKQEFSSTMSGSSIHRARNEPERQLGSLRAVLDNLRRDGGTPSVDSVTTELSGMQAVQRAPVLLGLQRTHGNRYVQRVVAGIQAKLKVGQPEGVYEQGVDRVAEQIVDASRLEIQRPVGRYTHGLTEGGKEATLEEDVMRKIEAQKGSGRPFEPEVCSQMEASFGHDFGGVRIHTDTAADKLAKELGAKAFTSGKDIFFREGAYQPSLEAGKGLLGHELTHFVQQAQGRTSSLDGLGGDEATRQSLEREAESMQQQVRQGELARRKAPAPQKALQLFTSTKTVNQPKAVQREMADEAGGAAPGAEGEEQKALMGEEPEIEIVAENLGVVSLSAGREREETMVTTQMLPAVQRNGNGGVSLGDIVNLASTAWTVIKDNSPTVNPRSDFANAVPRDVDWTRLSGWQTPPASVTWRLVQRNDFGDEVITANFRIMFTYGGRHNGHGLFINNATVVPMDIQVSWGWNLNANASIRNPYNMGTATDPLAAMQIIFSYTSSTVIYNRTRSWVYEVRGNGAGCSV